MPIAVRLCRVSGVDLKRAEVVVVVEERCPSDGDPGNAFCDCRALEVNVYSLWRSASGAAV